MRQFDVVANPFPKSRDRQPYLVALQSDLLARGDDIVYLELDTAGSGGAAAGGGAGGRAWELWKRQVGLGAR